MTDNEIIKVMEFWADALDLINRQQAEIKRLFVKKLKEKSVWDDLNDTKIVYEYEIDKLLTERVVLLENYRGGYAVDGLSLVKGGAEE